MICRTLRPTPWKFTPCRYPRVSVIVSAFEKPSIRRSQSRKDFDQDRLSRRLEETLTSLQNKTDVIEDENASNVNSEKTESVEKEPIYKFRTQRFKQKQQGEFFYEQSFEEVGMNAALIEALASINITQPSQIQGLAFEAFRDFGFQRSLLLADQAGSGKTLAYLGPLIQKLRFEEEQTGMRLTTPNQPRALIVVPTAELAGQVLQLCRSLATNCPFRSIAITGARRYAPQAQALKEGVDVVVCTPLRLINLLEAGSLNLENCKTVVLDEVDILLGNTSGFQEYIMKILKYVSERTQFFLATATIPQHIYSSLTGVFQELAVVLGPGLHCTAPGVTEQLVDCSGGDIINEETGKKRKAQAMLALIRSNQVQKTVVFCNKIETCRMVENYLKRHDKKETEYLVFPHHSAVSEQTRNKNLKVFMEVETIPMILVSTDRVSRGLDTYNVSHVILFDFPRDPSEYVRRVGRTARGAMNEGLVSILVLGRQVRDARRVLERSKRGVPVHKTPNETDAFDERAS